MVSETYTVNHEVTEFTTFARMATQLLAKYAKKIDEYHIDYDNQMGDIIALYMMGKVSRYGVTKYLVSHWVWEKAIDSLTLAEILQEADKYKPDYKGEFYAESVKRSSDDGPNYEQ